MSRIYPVLQREFICHVRVIGLRRRQAGLRRRHLLIIVVAEEQPTTVDPNQDDSMTENWEKDEGKMSAYVWQWPDKDGLKQQGTKGLREQWEGNWEDEKRLWSNQGTWKDKDREELTTVRLKQKDKEWCRQRGSHAGTFSFCNFFQYSAYHCNSCYCIEGWNLKVWHLTIKNCEVTLLLSDSLAKSP